MSALQVKIISMFHAFIGTSFRMANLWLPDFKVLRELTSSWMCSFNSHSFLTYLYFYSSQIQFLLVPQMQHTLSCPVSPQIMFLHTYSLHHSGVFLKPTLIVPAPFFLCFILHLGAQVVARTSLCLHSIWFLGLISVTKTCIIRCQNELHFVCSPRA